MGEGEAPAEIRDLEKDTSIKDDKLAFDEWIKTVEDPRTLSVPQSVLRYMLLPTKMRDMAKNPELLDVLVVSQDDQKLNALIVEYPNKADKEKTSEELLVYAKDAVEELESSDAADSRYWLHFPDAKVTHGIKLRIHDNDQLVVDGYSDRDEMRGQGVGKGFYENLHTVAEAMNFRFLSGRNNEDNIGFFKSLGRYTLRQIKPEYRAKFNEYITEDSPYMDAITVDIFHPEDKEALLSSDS